MAAPAANSPSAAEPDAAEAVTQAVCDGLRLKSNIDQALVRQLTGYGLSAIECYYPRHTPHQQAFYLQLAQRYGLHATGGSDFHGERVKPDISLAALELEISWLTGSRP